MEMYLRLLGSTTGDAYGNESGPMISMGEQPAIFQGMSMNEPMLMNPMMRMGHGVNLGISAPVTLSMSPVEPVSWR